MELDPGRCWRVYRSRDRRFDGRFFIGVVTTGVYCRPICPVSPPRRKNVRFYASAAASEEAGLRPCRRCRPETAPGTPAWVGSSATVSRALRLISEGTLDDLGVERFAERLGIGSRQLRRLFVEHLGAPPLSVARTRRVHFARRLIDETDLPMARVARASGFRSIRQFNHSVRSTFGRAPTALRQGAQGRRGEVAAGELLLRLPYRPPYDWDGILAFLGPRAIPGVEKVSDGAYRRAIELDASVGIVEIRNDPRSAQLLLRTRIDVDRELLQVVERVRRLFDLCADPHRIATDLQRDPDLARRIEARPGVRVPGPWDPFELSTRAVLGQQVSVSGATTLAGRLVRTYGKPLETTGVDGLTHLFPSPEVLAEADVSGIGLPRSRAEAIRQLARAVAMGKLSFDSTHDPESTLEILQEIPGIGDWTTQYIAMRVLGEPDAFPASDLGLRRALPGPSAPIPSKELQRRAEAWRPWRAYAAMWLWTSPVPAQGSLERRGLRRERRGARERSVT